MGGSISRRVTRICTAVGSLNTSLQYAAPRPVGRSRFDCRRRDGARTGVEGVSDRALAMSAEPDGTAWRPVARK